MSQSPVWLMIMLLVHCLAGDSLDSVQNHNKTTQLALVNSLLSGSFLYPNQILFSFHCSTRQTNCLTVQSSVMLYAQDHHRCALKATLLCLGLRVCLDKATGLRLCSLCSSMRDQLLSLVKFDARVTRKTQTGWADTTVYTVRHTEPGLLIINFFFGSWTWAAWK